MISKYLTQFIISNPKLIQIISQRTEPQPHVTCTENLVKFEHVVLKIYASGQTDTYRHSDCTTSPT